MIEAPRLQTTYRISLPRRGITMRAPEHVAKIMETAKKHKVERTRYNPQEREELWPEREKARIWLIKNCSILRKRYPNPQAGREYMQRVNPQRQEELLTIAHELSNETIEEWKKISSNGRIAILLFGSVAKGLTKDCSDPDPSNVDLAIIGDIKDDERIALLDAIRPARDRIKTRILEQCGGQLDSPEANPGNAGVFVQDISRLTVNNFSTAMNYIGSNAIALHDPAGVWKNIEGQALDAAGVKMRRHAQSNQGVIFSR